MNRPAFVVTGCGRSGTGYLAALLSAAGRPCGHEAIFQPDTEEVPSTFEAPVGDASWLAAPFVSRLPRTTVVVHLVRDPLHVVRSHLGIGFFSLRPQPPTIRVQNAVELLRRALGEPTRRHLRRDFLRFVDRHDPEILRGPSELHRCLRYWVRWNQLVELGASEASARYLRVAVERLDTVALGEILGLLGTDPGPQRLGEALARVPRDTNTRTRDGRVGREQLLEADEDGSLSALAFRYGYRALA